MTRTTARPDRAERIPASTGPTDRLPLITPVVAGDWVHAMISLEDAKTIAASVLDRALALEAHTPLRGGRGNFKHYQAARTAKRLRAIHKTLSITIRAQENNA